MTDPLDGAATLSRRSCGDPSAMVRGSTATSPGISAVASQRLAALDEPVCECNPVGPRTRNQAGYRDPSSCRWSKVGRRPTTAGVSYRFPMLLPFSR
jgi:hypothetical protein